MSLIATAGASNANAYGTVTEADDYFSGRYDPAAWTALTTAKKESALIMATAQIDAGFAYRGCRYGSSTEGASDYQQLEFPRNFTVDNDGAAIIPKNVKSANFEQAFFIVSFGAEAEKRQALIDSGVKSYSLGGVANFNAPALSENFGESAGSFTICAAAKNLLSPYIDNTLWLNRA